MRKLILFSLLLLANEVFAQEVLIVEETFITFENSADTSYFSTDTSNIMNIGRPSKSYLRIPDNNPDLGQNVLYTDTSQYYPENCEAWIQFKLCRHCMDFYDFHFYQIYDFESNKDGGIIETSHDYGETWTNIIFDPIVNKDDFRNNVYSEDDTIAAFNNQPGFTGLNSDGSYTSFRLYSIELWPDTLLLRFRFKTDSNNASNEGWLLDNFEFRGGLVPIENQGHGKNVSLQPNPGNGIYTLTGNTHAISNIEIYNLNGVKVLSHFNKTSNSIDLSLLPAGFYFLRSTYNNGFISTLKFQKL